jgi:NAD(P)-dependent dehydrogenase (short-subunit alcohol dehydrogenase family)
MEVKYFMFFQFPGICVYNMSKAALDALTQTVALELAPHGVRVNSVNPGVIVTDIHRRGGMSEEQYQKVTIVIFGTI